MNTPNRPRGFEDRLLHEFKDYFEERNQIMNATEETQAKTPRFSRGKKFSLAGGIGAVALGIGAVVALPMLTGSAAYAVETKEDGNVYVEVRSPEDAEGLEETLAEHGIKAKVDFPTAGHMCNPDRYTPGVSDEDSMESVSTMTGEVSENMIGFDVDPGNYELGGDNTLLIEISEDFFTKDHDETEGTGFMNLVSIATADGEIGECDPQPVEDEPVIIDDADKEDAGSDGEDDKGTNEQKDDDGSKDKN